MKRMLVIFVICLAACSWAQTSSSGNTAKDYVINDVKITRILPTVAVTDAARIATGEWKVLSTGLVVNEDGVSDSAWQIQLCRKEVRPDGVLELLSFTFDFKAGAGQYEHLYRMMQPGRTVWFTKLGRDRAKVLNVTVSSKEAVVPGVTGPTATLLPHFGNRPKDK